MGSIDRRILQVLVGIAAAQAIVAGALYLAQGVAGLSIGAASPLQFDPTDPAWSRVDYLYRAMAGIWFALGLMFAYMVPKIERHSAWFALASVGIFGMGVGRYLSSTSLPQVAENSTGAMIAELIIPPILVIWQRSVARRFRSDSPQGSAV